MTTRDKTRMSNREDMEHTRDDIEKTPNSERETEILDKTA